MRRSSLLGLACLLGITLLAGNSTFSADKETKAQRRTARKPVATEQSVTESDAKSPAPHLPAGWGKLGLSHEQHDKAIAVMQKYAPQIKQLQAQLNELRQNQNAEMITVLNETQKKQLAEATAAAAAKRAEARAANAARRSSSVKATTASVNPPTKPPVLTPDKIKELKEHFDKEKAADKK